MHSVHTDRPQHRDKVTKAIHWVEEQPWSGRRADGLEHNPPMHTLSQLARVRRLPAGNRAHRRRSRPTPRECGAPRTAIRVADMDQYRLAVEPSSVVLDQGRVMRLQLEDSLGWFAAFPALEEERRQRVRRRDWIPALLGSTNRIGRAERRVRIAQLIRAGEDVMTEWFFMGRAHIGVVSEVETWDRTSGSASARFAIRISR